MAEWKGPDSPKVDDAVYFEIPEAIDPITSLQTEVHVFLFRTLPPTSAQGLNQLAGAWRALKCQTRGLEDDRGGVELIAGWEIQNRVKPLLRKTGIPFRPSPGHGMRQIRVRVSDQALAPFEYLFDDDRTTWRPLLHTEKLIAGAGTDAYVETRRSGSREAWYRVNDLVRVGPGERMARPDRTALMDMSPESGNYILMSLRRRRREVESGKD